MMFSNEENANTVDEHLRRSGCQLSTAFHRSWWRAVAALAGQTMVSTSIAQLRNELAHRDSGGNSKAIRLS
jgi:hypothetical protein